MIAKLGLELELAKQALANFSDELRASEYNLRIATDYHALDFREPYVPCTYE